jgi:hypothetical protein
VGGLMSDGGSAEQTASKEPWKEAQPWILDNIKAGQDLQRYFQNGPFSALQQNAYGNLFAGNDYVRSMVPGLLSQLSQPVGFDRGNPGARPAPIQFPAMGLLAGGGAPQGGGMSAGLLGDMNVTQNPFRNGAIPAPVAAAPAVPKEDLSKWFNGFDRNLYGDT